MQRSVLHIAQPTDAGVARWIIDHAVRQQAAGWRVTVACPPDAMLPDALAQAGVAVRAWPARRAPHRGVPAERRAAAALLDTIDPDLVHLHSAKAGLSGRLAVAGRLPTVFSPHAWSFDALGGPARAAAAQWERYAARWVDRMLCVSEAEREHGQSVGVRAPYAVVPNGVDLQRHPATGAADRAQARLELGLDPTGPLVVCVGRLSRQKGQDLLLQAWPEVVRRVPDARLALVGDGPAAAALRRRTVPGVHFAGAAGDPRPWYTAASVVVVPSRWEGMAFVPLEAQAAGRCVVAADVIGLRESLPARAGALVAAGTADALVEPLAARLHDPDLADGEGARGRANVETRHDVDRLAEQVLAVYAEVLSERAGAGPEVASHASSRWRSSR